MEMRIENFEKELGQVISIEELESFLWNSELGVWIMDDENNLKLKQTEEILEELIIDDIEEIYYIKNNNLVKILYKNGYINEIGRV